MSLPHVDGSPLNSGGFPSVRLPSAYGAGTGTRPYIRDIVVLPDLSRTRCSWEGRSSLPSRGAELSVLAPSGRDTCRGGSLCPPRTVFAVLDFPSSPETTPPSIGVLPVELPLSGIALDVRADSVQFIVAVDYMLVVVSLPELAVVSRPAILA